MKEAGGVREENVLRCHLYKGQKEGRLCFYVHRVIGKKQLYRGGSGGKEGM